MTHECTPVGSADVAARLDLQPNSVHKYTLRGQMPAARWIISGKPVWCWEHDLAELPWVQKRMQRIQGAAAV